VNSVKELNPQFPKLLPLLSKTTESSWLLLAPQHTNRVRVERNNHSRQVSPHLVERINHMSVPEMHPVKISKGNHPTLEA
jgi:hypothetical protein